MSRLDSYLADVSTGELLFYTVPPLQKRSSALTLTLFVQSGLVVEGVFTMLDTDNPNTSEG